MTKKTKCQELSVKHFFVNVLLKSRIELLEIEARTSEVFKSTPNFRNKIFVSKVLNAFIGSKPGPTDDFNAQHLKLHFLKLLYLL